MTNDDDAVRTTRDFILRDKKYVKLALLVEKAALKIRNSAVKRILRRVDEHLRQRFCNREWTVDFVTSQNQPHAVRIRKRSWQCGGVTGWEGVRLDRNWDGENITVSGFENVKPIEIQQICDKQNIGTSRIRGSYVYCGLEGNRADWEGPDFIFEAWYESDKIADDLADKMDSWREKSMNFSTRSLSEYGAVTEALKIRASDHQKNVGCPRNSRPIRKTTTRVSCFQPMIICLWVRDRPARSLAFSLDNSISPSSLDGFNFSTINPMMGKIINQRTCLRPSCVVRNLSRFRRRTSAATYLAFGNWSVPN